jgi:hypothetical protein
MMDRKWQSNFDTYTVKPVLRGHLWDNEIVAL